MIPQTINNPKTIKTFSWEEINQYIPQKEKLRYGQNIEKIFKGFINPICNLRIEGNQLQSINASSREEALHIILTHTLTTIVKEKLGIRKASKEQLNSCCELIQNHFSHFGIPEIAFAFELASIGIITADTNLYGNDFSSVFLGKILGVYNRYRAKVIQIIRQAIRDMSLVDNTSEAEKELRNKKAREINVQRIVENYKIFFEGNLFKLQLGQYQLLQKLGYKFPFQFPLKGNKFLEKIKNKISKEEKKETVFSTDEAIRQLFRQLKKDKITPVDFQKDIQQKLENYEKEQNPNYFLTPKISSNERT